MLATLNTGLAADDVFYFGSAVGESGNSAIDAKVDAIDVLLARNNPQNATEGHQAALDSRYDYNRDMRVNATDMLIARSNQTHLLNALKLIEIPDVKQSAYDAVLEQIASQPSKAAEDPADTWDWMYELEQTSEQEQTSKQGNPAEQAVDLILASL